MHEPPDIGAFAQKCRKSRDDNVGKGIGTRADISMFANGLRKTDGVRVWGVTNLAAAMGRNDILNNPHVQTVNIQPVAKTLHQSTNT